MKRRWMVALISCVLFGMSASLAVAQEQGRERAASGRKRYTFGADIVVQGKIVKPQVQFIISREKGSSDEALVLRESFVPKILDSVQQAPF